MKCLFATHHEAKQFANKTADQKMDEKTRGAYHDELNQGFKRSLDKVADNTRSEIQRPLKPNALTSESDNDAGYIKSLFEKHAGILSGLTTPTASEPSQGFQSSPRGSELSANSDIQSPANKKPRIAGTAEVALMAARRLRSERLTNDLTKKEKALRAALMGCSKELAKGDILDEADKIWYTMAIDRYKAGVCLLGNAPMQVITADCVGSEHAFEKSDGDKAVAARNNTETLRKLLTAMSCACVERSESALSILEIRMEIAKINTAKSIEDIASKLIWRRNPGLAGYPFTRMTEDGRTGSQRDR